MSLAAQARELELKGLDAEPARDAAASALVISRAAMPDGGAFQTHMVAEKNRVASRSVWDGTITQTGRAADFPTIDFFRNRGELLLRHEHNGIDLKMDRAADTLANIQAIWNRPTHLQTVVENQPSLLSFDGSAHTMKNLFMVAPQND